MHWKPYHISCHPCQIDYNAIIKLESADDDTRFVMRISQLDKLASYEKKHETRGGASDKEDIRMKYFSQVSCSILMDVYMLYRYDFELFEYHPDEFLSICKSVKN